MASVGSEFFSLNDDASHRFQAVRRSEQPIELE